MSGQWRRWPGPWGQEALSKPIFSSSAWASTATPLFLSKICCSIGPSGDRRPALFRRGEMTGAPVEIWSGNCAGFPFPGPAVRPSEAVELELVFGNGQVAVLATVGTAYKSPNLNIRCLPSRSHALFLLLPLPLSLRSGTYRRLFTNCSQRF